MFNKILLQKIVYHDIRDKFRLAAQLAVRIMAKVVETVFHEFKDFGSIVYDQRILNFRDMYTVSDNTTKGGIWIPITIGKHGEIPFERNSGQCVLVRRNRIFYLIVAVDVRSGIMMGITIRKGNRYINNSWAFHQLRSFVEYKAKEAGILVIVVIPHDTSRECPVCHAIDKRNRAAVNQRIVAGAILDHHDPQVASQRALVVCS
ncbi:MAG: hypothetical protein B2I17_02645 [Thermoplasmatales archaeon B_DKE]|nr:MAG: hypothetical protein B2I17_02645 [Thermoplasmatales archaeon B_DKE]